MLITVVLFIMKIYRAFTADANKHWPTDSISIYTSVWIWAM